MRQTHRSRMSTPRLTKLRKQPNSTWAQLQKRLIALPDPFETFFPAEVWSFILNKSHSISTNPGYVSSTLITTTAFMAGTATTLKTATQEMPLNIYSIFVGPPLNNWKITSNQGMRYITHGQCNGRSRFYKPCNPEMYLVGTDKNNRRQQQRAK